MNAYFVYATRTTLLRLLLAGLVTLFGSNAYASSTTTAPLNIVTTTAMIADLVQNIGGKHVNVTALMGSGVDPHLYKATQGDLRRLSQADIIFYNGLMLEGKMQSVFEKMAKNKPVFAISDTLPKSQLLFHDNHPDPHIWFDLALWHQAGLRVLAHLQQQDPAHKADYQAQANAYLAQMTQLDTWVKNQVEQIPASQRILITAHDAFGYFGQAYGLKVMGLQGVSTASEFGLQDLKRLKDIIIAQNIKAVFIESSVSPRLIQSLVEGAKAQGHPLSIGGELYSDAMGLADTPTGTYFGMVKHNVTTLVNALK